MALLKCKMCGGDLEITEGMTVCECEYCGAKQTVPSADDEKKMTLFNRANRLRFNCEFDKASGVYESIVADFPEEAEAYWGLVLCKYGIEYVDDPATAKKIPTCHRSSFESVMDDNNFEQVMENADTVARSVYREEAKQIEELRKGIIEVSSKEEPYDIFICYKETDENGDRTVDSVIAQDVYDALTEKGYKIFFSRITLEDKLGQEYEPYIFAALNSAKVMLAFGTNYEYYNAVWVKNEWSRFLQLIAKGEKKTLIPCYKNIDAYDMPKEFAKLQAQDMGKVGAIQDLLRGIEKIIPKNTEKSNDATSAPVSSNSQTATTDSLLKRAFIFLEDGKTDDANKYFEKVLDIAPENALAYVGKLCINVNADKIESLKNCNMPFDNDEFFKKAMRYGDEKLITQLRSDIDYINNRNEEARKDGIYRNALKLMADSTTEESYKKAAAEFKSVSDWKDADDLAEKCINEAETCRKNVIYNKAVELMNSNEPDEIKKAIPLFESIAGWKEADDLAAKCPEHSKNVANDLIYDSAMKSLCDAESKSRICAPVSTKIKEIYVTIGHTIEYEPLFKYEALGVTDKYYSMDIRGIIKSVNATTGQTIENGAVILELYESVEVLEKALSEFSKIEGWKDASEKIVECKKRLQIAKEGVALGQKTKEEEDRIAKQKENEAQEQRERARKSEIKKSKVNLIVLSAVQLLISCLALSGIIYSNTLKTTPGKFYNHSYIVIYYVSLGCAILLSALCVLAAIIINKKAKDTSEYIPQKLSFAKSFHILAFLIALLLPVTCAIFTGINIKQAHSDMKQKIVSIKKAEDFIILKNYPFAHYSIETDIDFAEAKPISIGTFSGELNGQNHKVFNITNSEILLKKNTGKISDIVIENANADNYFIKENKGTISGVTVSGSSINQGLIENNKSAISSCSISDITVKKPIISENSAELSEIVFKNIGFKSENYEKTSSVFVGKNAGILHDLSFDGVTLTGFAQEFNDYSSENLTYDFDCFGVLCCENEGDINHCTIENVSSTVFQIKECFGVVAGKSTAKISDTNVINASLDFSSPTFGGICGDGTEIFNCNISGKVSNQLQAPEVIFGGIAGKANQVTYSQCNAELILNNAFGKISSSATKDNFSGIGGIVGMTNQSENSCIQQCSNVGKMNISISWVSEDGYTSSSFRLGCGGIMGCKQYFSNYNQRKEADVTISNCYSSADITVKKTCDNKESQDCWSYFGGISGQTSDSYNGTIIIDKCYSSGKLTQTSTDRVNCLGGIMAYSPTGCSSTVSDSFFTGQLNANFDQSGSENVWVCGQGPSNCWYSPCNLGTNYWEKSKETNAKSFRSKSFIVDTLGWDPDIWDIRDGSLPTLKPYVEAEK